MASQQDSFEISAGKAGDEDVEVVVPSGESFTIGPDSSVSTDDPDTAAWVADAAQRTLGTVTISHTFPDGEPALTSVSAGARPEEHPDAVAAQQEAADKAVAAADKKAAKESTAG